MASLAQLLPLADIHFTVFQRDISSKPTPRFESGTLDGHPGTSQQFLRPAVLHDKPKQFTSDDATTVTLQDWRDR